MIYVPNSCEEVPLHRLVDGNLSIADQDSLTKHLDQCDTCRQRLTEITSDVSWWQETRCQLSSLADEAPSAMTSSLVPDPTNQHIESRSAQNFQTATKRVRKESASRQLGTENWLRAILAKHSDRHVEINDASDGLGWLDELHLIRVVGQGGMGIVVQANDPALHRSLAIKILSPMLSNNGVSRQRFFREAQSAAAVVHPNIVPIYSMSQDGNVPYLTMPFIGGGSLQERLTNHGALSIEQTLLYAMQVAEGLDAAHQRGIVHRDIKPANLLLDDGGFRVLITDFGLARALDDASLTASGMLAGTPPYMSPEQAMGECVDHRTDIYSLGAVMYAMTTGHAPFEGESTMEILRMLREETPKPVGYWNESYPGWFESLIQQLLAKSPEKRIQNTSELVLLLRDCLLHVRAPQKHALPGSLQHHKSKTIGRSISIVASGCLLGMLSMFAMPTAHDSFVQPEAPNVSNGTPNTDANEFQTLSLENQNTRWETNLLQPQSNPSSQADSHEPPTSLDWNATQFESQIYRTEQSLRRLEHELQFTHEEPFSWFSTHSQEKAE